MSKKKRIIPFSWWPANWGLTGDRKKLAEAEYFYEGEELAREKAKILAADEEELKVSLLKLDKKFEKITPEEFEYQSLDLKYSDKESKDYLIARAELDLKFKKITEVDLEYRILELNHSDHESTEFKIARVELDLKFEKIDENEAEKQIATLQGEPWFRIVGGDHRSNGDASRLTFELDWNDEFVEFLVQNGFGGQSDDEIVDMWFTRTCREMMLDDLEEIDETPMGGTAFSRTRKERDDKGRSAYF